MENKKDLGTLFKKRLAEAEAEPSDNLWDSIESTLDSKRKKRGGFLFFWSALVLILILLGTTYILLGDSFGEKEIENIETPVVKIDPPHKNRPKKENSKNPESISESKRHRINSEDSNNFDENTKINKQNTAEEAEVNQQIPKVDKPVSNSRISNHYKSKNAAQMGYTVDKKTIAKNKKRLSADEESTTLPGGSEQQESQNPETSIKNQKTGTLTESIETSAKVDSIVEVSKTANKKDKKKVVDEIKKKEDPKQEWLVTVQAAPTLYGYMGEDNPFDKSISTGQLRSGLSYAYGALLNIPLNDKLTFRFGFRNTKLKFYVEEATGGISDNGTSTILNAPSISRNNAVLPSKFVASLNPPNSFRIDQELTYQEVPLQFLYRLSDERVQIDAIFGLSAMLLSKNSIALSNDTGNVVIGSATYLKKATLSSSLGIGFRYQLSPRVRIDLEPTFQYQFGATEADFGYLKPIILSLNTGATIRL